MSYIRGTSNPENLYIWGDGKTVYIARGQNKLKSIPQKTFDRLLKKYNKTREDSIFRGAKIEEVFVEKKEKLSKKRQEFLNLLGIPQGDFKIRLSYKDWHIDMWRVTWEYITNNL